MSELRALLVDDHFIVRAGLKKTITTLYPEWELFEAGDGTEAIKVAARVEPDLIFMDEGMPVMHGIPAAIEILREQPDVKIILCSGYESSEIVFQAINAGFKGFIPKLASPAEIHEAVKNVLAKKLHFPGNFTDYALKLEIIRKDSTDNILTIFSPRESEILQLIVDGLTSKEIADKLDIKKSTVDSHRANLLSKSKSKNTPELVKFARESGSLG